MRSPWHQASSGDAVLQTALWQGAVLRRLPGASELPLQPPQHPLPEQQCPASFVDAVGAEISPFGSVLEIGTEVRGLALVHRRGPGREPVRAHLPERTAACEVLDDGLALALRQEILG